MNTSFGIVLIPCELTRISKCEPRSLTHDISLHICASQVAVFIWIRWQDIMDGEEVAD